MPAPQSGLSAYAGICIQQERNKVKNGAYVGMKYCTPLPLQTDPFPGIENEYAIMSQIVPNLSVEMVNQSDPGLGYRQQSGSKCLLPEKEGLKVPSKEEILAAVNKVKAGQR